MPKLTKQKMFFPFKVENRLRKCKNCELYKTRHKIVIGRGKIPADILFIGEKPNSVEDQIGLPYVGKVGLLFDKMIKDACSQLNTPLFSYYISNIVLCRPVDKISGESRATKRTDFESCLDNVFEIISYVKPKIVIYVGRVAERFLSKYLSEYKTFLIQNPNFIFKNGGISCQYYHLTVQTLLDAIEELKK